MKTSVKVLHWTPRIICILAILLISVFAADAFGPGLTLWQQLGGFLIHLIPSFVLIAVLVVAWKWETAGGVIFILLGLGLSPFIFKHNYDMNHSVSMSLSIIMMVNFPFVLTGILFILSDFQKKRNLWKQ